MGFSDERGLDDSPQARIGPQPALRERRTERIKLSIPIRVTSLRGTEKDFVEDTHALIVNRDGALITLRHRLVSGELIRISNLENSREADCRVVGEVTLEGSEYSAWGVEFLETGQTIWGIEFPPPLDYSGARAAALLQCPGCNTQALHVLSLVELELLESAGTLEKPCEQCGRASNWIYADATRRPREPAATEALVPPPSALPGPGEWGGEIERHEHRRLAVKLSCLVRNAQGEDELARSEDVSKGGLSVLLKMDLPRGDVVTVIFPYSEGTRELGRKAEVRHREPFPGQKHFYGLRFVQE